MKPDSRLLQSTRLLDQVSERIRYMHYSLKTEKACLYWVRFFIRWSAAQPGGMRHPREMGVADLEAFLSMMVNERVPTPYNFCDGVLLMELATYEPFDDVKTPAAGTASACIDAVTAARYAS